MIRPFLVFVLIYSLLPTAAMAWGKRGHSIVCQTAAALIATKTHGAEFLKKHSFDLGYGCNVPDLVWKKPATYDVEAPQHFMDLEVFDRAFKKNPSKDDPFALSRAEFEKKYPDVPMSAGRSYWRITELVQGLDETAKLLKSASKAKQHDLQEEWLIKAAAIGHYVGDLSQPLHVTENYDGVMTNQKGIHAFFEDVAVDELSSTDHPGALEAAVGEQAQKEWAAYNLASAKLNTLTLVENLARSSNESIPELLRLDKTGGRKDLKKAALAFEPLIRARLTAGSLALAEIWSRELGWIYDGEKFYNFTPAPEFIPPASSKSTR